MKNLRYGPSVLCLVCLATGLTPFAALAAAAPDAGTLLQDIERIIPSAPSVPSAQVPVLLPQAAPQAKAGEVRVLVNDFKIESQQFSETELKAVLKEYIGKELSLPELQDAARKIDAYYREKGFMARAVLPKQSVKDGVILIRVIEGRLGKIKIDPSSDTRFDAALAEDFVDYRMPVGQLMKLDALGEGVMILNEIPGVAAEASLQPGAGEGETDAVIKLTNRPLVSGGMEVNNEGVRSVGIVRGIGYASLNNAFGVGDQTSFTVVKSYLSDYGRLGFTVPVGASGLALGINGSALQYAVDDDLSSARQKGYAYTGGLTASYPLLRSATMSVTSVGSYDHKKLVNSVLDLNSSNKDIDVGSVGVNSVWSDDFLGGSTTTLEGAVSGGSLDLGLNADNLAQDKASAKTDGLYSKYTLRASRLQGFDTVNQLFVSVNGQMASSNLDSSEQISLGGPDGVRAYPVNEGMGSAGFLSRIELRHNVLDNVQLFDFYDAGWVQQYVQTWNGWNPNAQLTNDYWLQGIGVGVTWRPLAMAHISFTAAHTLGSNLGKVDGRNSDGYNDHMRFWLKAGLVF